MSGRCTTPAGILLLGAEESPSLPILSSLAGHGIPLTVGSHRRVCAGFFSRFPRRRLIYPDPSRNTDRFVEWLVAQVRTGEYPVTIGCGEQITYLLSRHKPELVNWTSVPVADLPIFMKCRDKSRTMRAAARCGVPTPATWYPEESGIGAVAEQASYPAVLKPCVSDGARGIRLARSPGDLLQAHDVIHSQYGPCIVQEYIPHGGMQYKAELLLDAKGAVRLKGAYAKLRYYPPTGGSSTLNQTVRRDDALGYAEKLLTYVGWYGMGDCDFILDPRDGVIKLMEVNPRFTRTIRILVEAGLDFPWELYRLALGEGPDKSPEYRMDVFLRYLPADLAWFLRSPERFSAKPSFFRFFSGNLHYEEWSLRDPLTGVGLWSALALDLLNPEARRNRMR